MSDSGGKVPDPPVLGVEGLAFWRELREEFEFDAKESALVLEACRTLDVIAGLAEVVESAGLLSTGSAGQVTVHPAVPELRQQQAAFARLIGQVVLPGDEEAADRFRQARARAGAAARWERPLKAVR